MKQTLKYIYSLIYDDMKFAESKHNIVLTISGIVLAFATTFLGNNIAQTLFSIGSIIFSLIAILYSFVALVSRNVKVKQKKEKEHYSLLAYKDIVRFDEKGYIEKIKKDYSFTNLYKPDKMDYDLAREIISVSKLTWIKFIYFNFAIVFLIMSIICIIATVLIKGQIW